MTFTDSSPTFTESPKNPTIPPGDIGVTVSNHHELLIRMDERLKTFVTREDLLKLEARLTQKISEECSKTNSNCQTLVKWCIGTIIASIIAVSGTMIFSYFSLTKEEEATVKLFVVSENQTRSTFGAEATEIPREILEATLPPAQRGTPTEQKRSPSDQKVTP